MPKYWILKTEPETFSFETLKKNKKTNWDLVRNYQARNNLKLISKNDPCLIYHSGKVKAIVGLASCSKEHYEDAADGEGLGWVQIDIAYDRSFDNEVTLSTLKSNPVLKNMTLVKQSRLSVSEVSSSEFKLILKLAQK